MRISTQAFYDQSLKSMNAQQANLMGVQEKLGAGTRIVRPSDDPVAAARALGVSQSLAAGAQYKATRGEASHTLSLEENALQDVTTVLQNVQSLVVQAGNGTMTDADRQSIATTLESAKAQLLGLANTDDGNGQYLFAGFRSGSAPFVQDGSGVVHYQGDQGQRMMQVDVARQIPGTDNGLAVFQSVQGGAGYVASTSGNTGTATFGSVSVMDPSDPNHGKDFSIGFSGGNYTVQTNDVPPVTVATGAYTSGTPISFGGLQVAVSGAPADGDVVKVSAARNAGDMFSAISDLVAALRTPVDSGGDTAHAQLLNALSSANVRIGNSYNNVLTVRSALGSRLSELDSLDTDGQARNTMDQTQLSNLKDLDYTSTISEFYQRQTALQATQQTFLKIQQISLFNSMGS
jgi:flagellar hook-associated protein 3 FlgL